MKIILISFLLLAAGALSFAQAPDTLWTRTYGSSCNEFVHDVEQTSDGGYVLVGWASRPSGAQFYVLKTDESGNVQWTRELRPYGGSMARAVVLSTPGTFVIAGEVGLNVNDYQAYLVKMNNAGDTLWTREYGLHGPGYSKEVAWDVAQTPDGGFLLVGTTTTSFLYEDFYVVRTDSAGWPIWERAWGGRFEEEAYAVIPIEDGGYVLAGYSIDSVSQSVRPRRPYVAAIDSLGIVQWEHKFMADWEATDIVQTSDGGYFVMGAGQLLRLNSHGDSLWSTVGCASDRIINSSCDTYVLAGAGCMMKITSGGDTLWVRDVYSRARALRQTTDLGYIVAGDIQIDGRSHLHLTKTVLDLTNLHPTPSFGFVTSVSQGPPNWEYELHWLSGCLDRLTFKPVCVGTNGWTTGEAAAAGWSASVFSDSVVFSTAAPLTSGSLSGFILSHSSCSHPLTWVAGDSSGMIDGPLPVELASFDAISSSSGIRLSFSTASETNNDFFEILRGTSSNGVFSRIATLPSSGNSATGHHYEYLDCEVTAGRTYWYYLADVDLNGNRTEHRERMRSASMSGAAELPSDFALSAHPNPFNPSTTISFALPEVGLVKIAVYDVSGRWIRTLVNEERAAGTHSVTFDARDLPSGVYFARMESETFAMTRKVLLIR